MATDYSKPIVFDISKTTETSKLAYEIMHILNGHSFKDIIDAQNLVHQHLVTQQTPIYRPETICKVLI